MLNLLIGPVVDLAKTYITGKIDNKKAQNKLDLEVSKAKSEIAKKVAAGEMEWNQVMAEASSSSWKDEWLTILVSIPLILAFAGQEETVIEGFKALEAMPDFYKTAVAVVFAASFGVQQLTKMFKNKIKF